MTKKIDTSPQGWSELLNPSTPTNRISLSDHLGGFDSGLGNPYLDVLNQQAKDRQQIIQTSSNYIFDNAVREKYSYLDFQFETWTGFEKLQDYHIHPDINHQNFLCSFNGSPHVSRKLLVSILHRFGWFNMTTCSKNFCYDSNVIDGHVKDFVDHESFYRKFFISHQSDDFFGTLNSFDYERYDHANNIYILENKLTSSFLQVVSETMATSYYPFMSEKFLYSVVTRGLFIAYAQPRWHDHLERYWGFRRYDKIFDYRFDSIGNPIERLIELISMLAKFSILSPADWRDLYEMERETIEYNYEHYFSRRYRECLESANRPILA